MKKLFLTLSFLMTSYNVFADAVSTGTAKFVLPSTNTVDATKSWATKNNDNWQKADTLLNGIINGGNGAESPSFILFKDTAQARIQQLSLDTGTITGGGSDNLGSHVATNTIQAPFGIDGSSGVFTASVTAYGGFFSTNGVLGGGSTFTSISLLAGAVGAPFLYSITERTTGWYRSGTNAWGFATSGASLLTMAGNNFTMGSGKAILLDPGTEATPGLQINGAAAGTGIWANGAGDWQWSDVNDRSILTLRRNGAVMLGNAKGSFSTAPPGVVITTITANGPILTISSNAIAVQVTQSSSAFYNNLMVSSPTVIFSSLTVLPDGRTGLTGGISASTYTINGDNIFYSTSTDPNIMPNPRALDGFIVCKGSVTALGTGGTQVVAPSGMSAIRFPMLTEVAVDGEANQMNISAITATSFTIKNKSALNAKDAIWWCDCKR